VIHQPDVVIGTGVPRPVDFERPHRLAAIGVAQIRRNNAVLALELLQRVEGVIGEARDRGVQTAAGDDHQREAGAGLFVMDANVAFFENRHGNSSLVGFWRNTPSLFRSTLLHPLGNASPNPI